MMHKQQIIVVDDEADIAELLRVSLSKAGYSVKTFADGAAFFQGVDDCSG